MRLAYHGCLTLVILCLAAIAARAHEAWIDPVTSRVAVGEPLSAHLRVGEGMRGGSSAYLPRSFQRLIWVQDGVISDITGKPGDRPAITIPEVGEGLGVIAAATNASKIGYKSFEKFATFARTHAQDFAIAAHSERGLPPDDFSESYYRFAKALVAGGDGAGQDRALGMPFELTALDNPYAGETQIRVQLTYLGDPVPEAQIELYHRPPDTGGKVPATLYRTDADGIVVLPLSPGRFLANSVRLEAPHPKVAEGMGVVWQSLWASLTWHIE